MRWMVITAISALSLVLTIVAMSGVVRTYRVQSGAMTPTIPNDAHVPAVRARNAERGDIITFRYPLQPQSTFVKRVVAVGGDTVEVRAKKLIVNGREAVEPYVVHEDAQVYSGDAFLPEPYRSRDQFGPYVVPAKHFFVMGDNHDRSADSRYRGAVPHANVLGRVVLVY